MTDTFAGEPLDPKGAAEAARDLDEMIAYRNTESGLTFVRSAAEFNDGRFEVVEKESG